MVQKASKGLEALAAMKADATSSAATLEAVAEKHIAEFAPDLQRASMTFVAVVAGQQSLAAQLFGRSMIEAKAREWFATFARRNSPNGEGASQAVPQGHSLSAPENSAPMASADLPPMARRKAPSRAESNDDGGPPGDATSANHALPTVVTPKPSAGHRPGANKALLQLPAARPQSVTEIRAAGRAAKQIALTVYETFRVHGDRPIGDVRYSEIPALARRGMHASAVLLRIKESVQPPPGTDPTVREMVSRNTLERFIEVRNAA